MAGARLERGLPRPRGFKSRILASGPQRGRNADGRNNVGWSAFTGSVHQPKEGIAWRRRARHVAF